MYSRQSGEITHVVSCVAAVVTEYRGEAFFSSMPRTEEIVKVYKYDINTKMSEMLFSYQQKSDLPSLFSVSAQYIAVTDKDNNRLNLYNRRSEVVTNKKLSGLKMIYNLLFMPDGCFLVTGWDNGKYTINKYSRASEEEEPVLIWSCDQVPDAVGVAVDERGLIYVSGLENKTIYILSAEGMCDVTKNLSLVIIGFVNDLIIKC